ncbi:hypothetical protein [Leptospira santarosai]|uniref:hypothetical protein n=1 Tax=Leptospira santarosai TaxID=28183 RepID=UPI0007748B39|nr:hypothetical protein [Leptospira santarosai]
MKLSDYKPILENEAKFKDMAQLAKIKGYVVVAEKVKNSRITHYPDGSSQKQNHRKVSRNHVKAGENETRRKLESFSFKI